MKKISLLLISIVFITLTNSLAAPLAEEIMIVGAINDGVYQQRKVFYLREGEELTLCPVLKVGEDYCSPINSFFDGFNLPHRCRLYNLRMEWFRINPVLKEYRNGYSLKNGTSPYTCVGIEYISSSVGRQTDILCLSKIPGANANGTSYITCKIERNDRLIGGPPLRFFTETEPLQEKYAYQVIQIVQRKDDSYLGYLTEMLGTPFILPPKRTLEGFHQTDTRIGSDCASFAIYGRRRMGYSIPYCGPKGIYRYLEEIQRSPLMPTTDGIYKNNKGGTVKVGPGGLEPGDILHFRDQVAVFYEDKGIKEKLDKNDLVFESLDWTPHVTTIEKCGYYNRCVRIFKWRALGLDSLAD